MPRSSGGGSRGGGSHGGGAAAEATAVVTAAVRPYHPSDLHRIPAQDVTAIIAAAVITISTPLAKAKFFIQLACCSVVFIFRFYLPSSQASLSPLSNTMRKMTRQSS